MTARVSMLLKSRASLTFFRACFLPGRAKDLSTRRVLLQTVQNNNIKIFDKKLVFCFHLRLGLHSLPFPSGSSNQRKRLNSFGKRLMPTIRGADKSLALPGKKQARKHVRDARDFNNIETRAVIKLLYLQGKTPKEIHAILTETLACFLPGRAKY